MDKNHTHPHVLPTRNLLHKRIHRLKMKAWKKICQVNGNQKYAGITMLTSDKTDFKSKTLKRDKEGHYIWIKVSIQQEDVTIVNMCTLNTIPSIYIKKILLELKGEKDSNTKVPGDFNTPFSSMDRSSRQKHQ